MVRAQLHTESLPFVMMTAVGDETTLSQAERYGVSTYLEKPLNVRILQRLIAEALAGVVPASLAEKYAHLRSRECA